MHSSKWITFFVESCLLLYSFVLISCIPLLCDCSFHFYHHITYICYFVASYLFLLSHSRPLWHYFVLLSEEIQFSLLRFPYLSHVQVFSGEISLFVGGNAHRVVFLPIFVFWLFFFCWCLCLMLVSFLTGYNQSSPSSFLCNSSSCCIDVSTLTSMLESLLPPYFLYTYSLSVLSLWCNALCIVISCLVLWSICLSSSPVHFKNGLKYLTRETAQVFVPLMRFLQT